MVHRRLQEGLAGATTYRAAAPHPPPTPSVNTGMGPLELVVLATVVSRASAPKSGWLSSFLAPRAFAASQEYLQSEGL